MSKYKEYLGIVLGALYALAFRLLGGMELMHGTFTLYSLTFVWLVPLLVGIIPILIARNEMRNFRVKQFLYPFISILIFAVISLLTRIEDIVCILILAVPFMAGAAIFGLIVGIVLDKIDERKGKKNNNNLYSLVLLIPLFLNPVESILPSPQKEYEVK